MRPEVLTLLAARLRPEIERKIIPLGENYHQYVVFFSLCDKKSRAEVITISGIDFAAVWKAGLAEARRRIVLTGMKLRWLRVDWVDEARAATWAALKKDLSKVKRNYYRKGISFDPAFTHAFLETELNANAALYGGAHIAHGVVNEKNFSRYAHTRHGLRQVCFADDTVVHTFTTQSIFASLEQSGQHHLHGTGRNTGRRIIGNLDSDQVMQLIENSSSYLSRQVKLNGRFHYGWHPCFDRAIPTYNTLRHASSLYSMIEAWEVTRDEKLGQAIERGLCYLTSQLIRQVTLPDGRLAAFLLEQNKEIKLGGNAVCLLALVKYSELTGTDEYLPLLEQLAVGILAMQDLQTGKFVHVLNYPELDLKEEFRIIYYDGEAAFGLMRLYGLTQDPRWLQAVELAFDYFIAADHWKAHDHWLSYCVNELTRYRPEERYFRFGINNVADHLDFVHHRITTFPTLLELMMAAREMLTRIDEIPSLHHLFDEIDLLKFKAALEHRAGYLLNGHFWPELAMFYENPQKIAGSFFIRHHSFRVRIDDVEHYLSGYVAYLRYLDLETEFAALVRNRSAEARDIAPVSQLKVVSELNWDAEKLLVATNGRWVSTPPDDWSASGLCIYAPAMQPDNIAVMRTSMGEKGILPERIKALNPPPAAIITTDPDGIDIAGIPVLQVADTGQAILDIGQYSRTQISGKVLAVTGSAGKTTTTAMLAHALNAWGEVGMSAQNANRPHGVAWNLASIGWNIPHVVLELAIGLMGKSARMARPKLAVFTNILPVHMDETTTLRDLATTKSAIFSGMQAGDIAVLNRNMQEWQVVYDAAAARHLTIIHYGTSDDCDYQLLNYCADHGQVTVRLGKTVLKYQLNISGEHMALNSVAVLAAISELGYPVEPAIKQLQGFTALSGRGEETALRIDGKDITLIDDAYNANTGSMQAAIQTLSARKTAKRRIVVLGEMAELGQNSEAYHTALGMVIAQSQIDKVYVIGALYNRLWDALPEGLKGLSAQTLDELQTALSAQLLDGDVVLIKGSNSTRLHELVHRIKALAVKPSLRSVELPVYEPAMSILVYNATDKVIAFEQSPLRKHPAASLTKLLTLSLIEDRMLQQDISAQMLLPVEENDVKINSHWGFQAGQAISIENLMRATAIVSANEAANILARWHSGTQEQFIRQLNLRAAEWNMFGTKFSSASGLGRGQSITCFDAAILAQYLWANYPLTTQFCAERSFQWQDKQFPNSNRLLAEIDGADGLKTGTLAGHGNHLLFTVVRAEKRWIITVLGASSKAIRDAAIKRLIKTHLPEV